MIDVTRDVDVNPDFLLTPERIAAWESDHGRIPRGAWVLLRTGWSRRTDAASFMNVGADGPHSPGFDARASKMLAEDRDVLGVGVETIGTDAGQADRGEHALAGIAEGVHLAVQPRLVDGILRLKAVLHHLGTAHCRREGHTQVMRGRAQELIARLDGSLRSAARLLGLAIEAGVVDRRRRVVGEVRGHGQVWGSITAPRLRRGKDEHAQHAAGRHERLNPSETIACGDACIAAPAPANRTPDEKKPPAPYTRSGPRSISALTGSPT